MHQYGGGAKYCILAARPISEHHDEPPGRYYIRDNYTINIHIFIVCVVSQPLLGLTHNYLSMFV